MNDYGSIFQLAGMGIGTAIGGPAGAAIGSAAGGLVGSIANLFVPEQAPRTVYDVNQSFSIYGGDANYNVNNLATTSNRIVNEHTIMVKEESPAMQALHKLFNK